MNISGVSVAVDSTGHLVGSTLTEIPIHENDVTAVLMQRWIACYMLYDWNPHHAGYAYLNNKCDWTQQVINYPGASTQVL